MWNVMSLPATESLSLITSLSYTSMWLGGPWSIFFPIRIARTPATHTHTHTHSRAHAKYIHKINKYIVNGQALTRIRITADGCTQLPQKKECYESCTGQEKNNVHTNVPISFGEKKNWSGEGKT